MKNYKKIMLLCAMCGIMMAVTACGDNADEKDTINTTEASEDATEEKKVSDNASGSTETVTTAQVSTEITAASSITEAAKESVKEETASKKTMTVYHGDGSDETVTEDSDGTWLTAGGKRYYLGDDGILRARGEEDLYVNNPLSQ